MAGLARVFEDFRRDTRQALRQMRRSPGFTVLAVLCLGLGIGANTAIFSIVNSVLLRPMPVAEPSRLVMLVRGQMPNFSFPVYEEVKARSRVLAGLTGSLPMESDLEVNGESEFVTAEAVTSSYASVLGVRLALGRWVTDETEPSAVISYSVWQRRFQLDPGVLGRLIRSESQSYTVVGVAPQEFSGIFAPLRTDLWVPIRTRPALAAQLDARGTRPLLMLFGRLRGDATPQQASAELNIIDAEVGAAQGADKAPRAPIVATAVAGVANPGTRRIAQTLATLLAVVVGLVLLIACVNVANLLLVRGTIRQREFAMRRALGATRFRLFRQLLTESLLLASGGGVCGVVLAVVTNRLLELSVPSLGGAFAVQLDLALDWRVILFAAFVSLTATVLSALLPARRVSQARGLIEFKSEIGTGTGRKRPVGLVAQVVVSLVLLFIVGSFLQALFRLQNTDPGFQVARRLYAYAFIPAPPFTPETGREFYSRALERLSTLPGIRSAALASSLPLVPSGSDCASVTGGPQVPTTTSAVGTGYFDTMAIGRVAGRDFGTEDLTPDSSSVVINEALARALWPNGSPVGNRVTIGCKTPQPAVVVGVVRNSAIRALGEAASPHVYRPFAQQSAGRLTAILLAIDSDPVPLVEPVRRALLEMGQGIRVYAVQPLDVHVEQSYARVRWQTMVLVGFGALALLLAAVGLYGVIAYRVTLRTREIGLRMALGATRKQILGEVVRYGLSVVLIGVVVGEVLAAALTGLAGSMQGLVRPTGITIHVAVGVIWIVVAILACWLPAARAARVDPLRALRYE